MKISQIDDFQPVTIVIETELELAELYNHLNTDAVMGTAAHKISRWLFNNEVMNASKADAIIAGAEK